MTSDPPVFTVFTPTFNRHHTLGRVYKSLLSQTFTSFEWIIIDDGSTDQTRELVYPWLGEAPFPITYVYQTNRGKHVAFNRAVALARAELFVPADSDDEYVASALERFYHLWLQIPEAERHHYNGVTCLCIDSTGKLIGDPFPCSPFDTTSLDICYRHKIKGDKCGFLRTSVLKAYPFPEPPDTRFVTESLLWNAIARKYRIRCINETLLKCHRDAGNQLTRAPRSEKCLSRAVYASLINQDLDYFPVAPIVFLHLSLLYSFYSFLAGDSLQTQWKRLRIFAKLLWLIVCIPAALITYVHRFHESVAKVQVPNNRFQHKHPDTIK